MLGLLPLGCSKYSGGLRQRASGSWWVACPRCCPQGDVTVLVGEDSGREEYRVGAEDVAVNLLGWTCRYRCCENALYQPGSEATETGSAAYNPRGTRYGAQRLLRCILGYTFPLNHLQ
ncbi:hypothetical protein PV04_00374 [Phialophora macrospora]|uniref:Uncharacterized protein n=1 Tax=Phialophora macrospora TaxID=1851006 RepID=A0A0D2G084_9EURO|nr:hypothetical protein PV04_00374 [Phialophora macrospora]